ncbi:hypothetical protein POTOM_021109 [Populus tomentosa]|uniref:Uncharacterized protein n=1 Tax=Populus tomentosa TaxID=118781 RepID=A0A8X7ZTA0_POPTO|nr:hypothetical protein POTOM_021109 [Populus tomentosa]
MARKRVSRNWFDKVRRKFLRTSHRNIILNSKACSSPSDEITEAGDYEVFNSTASPPSKRELAMEDTAAITIQANFRGHLVCEAGISSTQEPGEIASVGSRGACKEAITHSPAMHARARPVAGPYSCEAAPRPVK